jgi:hypothetical protein
MLTNEIVESWSVSDTDKCPITTAFQDLFSILGTWDHEGDLMLDISIYWPSDSEHWFKYLTFMPDIPPDMGIGTSTGQIMQNKAYDDQQHGWVNGSRHSAPSWGAMHRVFHSVMGEGPFDSDKLELQWWDQLPLVPVVTSVLIRQQNRRRWKPDSLAHMFARFPGLQNIYYEPWREWWSLQRHTNRRKFCCTCLT